MYLRIIWELCELVFKLKQVAGFVRNELVQVHEAVEKNANVWPHFLQLLHAEVAFEIRLHQVVHLAQQVDEEDGLVVEVLQAVDLLFVEVVHFVGGYYVVAVEVDDLEPVGQGLLRRLVFLIEHEPDEVLVVHLVFLITFELAGHLVEDPVDGFARQGVALVAGEVFFVNVKIMVGVQLPEATVKHVEVFVGEVLADYVYVSLVRYLLEDLIEVRLLKVAPRNLAVVVGVDQVEDSHYYGVAVAFLELRSRLQEF